MPPLLDQAAAEDLMRPRAATADVRAGGSPTGAEERAMRWAGPAGCSHVVGGMRAHMHQVISMSETQPACCIKAL